MTPPLVIPSYPKLSPHIGLIGMGGGATSRRFYTASSSDETYNIEKSLEFQKTETPYLKREITNYGNARTWTYSCWVKVGHPTEDGHLLGGYSDTNNRDNFYLGGSNWFGFNMKNNGSWHVDKVTDMNFTDTSAWQHLVIRWDTTQATTTERARLYVNGKEVTWSTTGFSVTDPAQNAESIINQSGSTFYIGAGPNNDGSLQSSHWFGLISDAQFIDGESLSPAAFGSFDSANNWNPKTFALPNPNDGTVWSDSYSGSPWSGYPFTMTFDGDLTTGTEADASTTNTWTPSTPITAK